MNFVNRDGRITRQPGAPRDSDIDVERVRTHGEALDAFFAAEEGFNPRYRRVFRVTDHGSVIIDLLDRVTY
jgi:hypothetical protein